jgi:hypothetical protein
MMATLILRPDSNCSVECSPYPATNYLCVDEVSLDVGSYVEAPGGGGPKLDLYTFANHTTESGVISNVKVKAYLTYTGSPPIEMNLYVTASNYGAILWTTDGEYDCSWATHPSTGTWTWTDIDALIVGIGFLSHGSSQKCCQIYVEVTYTPLPTVTTQAVTSVTSTTATGNGNITDDGGATITERGICYSTSTNPTTLNSTSHDHTNAEGAFTMPLIGLLTGITYHCKAYAINSSGTSYGDEVDFKTLSFNMILIF